MLGTGSRYVTSEQRKNDVGTISLFFLQKNQKQEKLFQIIRFDIISSSKNFQTFNIGNT